MYSRLNFIFTILLFSTVSVQAKPLQILKVDSQDYPRISVDISIQSPHPAFISSKKQNSELEIHEIFNNREEKITINQKVFQSNENINLNIVIILDATKSISKKSFKNARENARKLLLSLKKSDKSVVYALKGKPFLIADVSSNHSTQALKLDTVSHDGKRTRLYDTLYSGLFTARSMALDNKKKKMKTVVVLFTDGRDEGSYLTDNDCFELTKLGKKLSIPIYTILSKTLNSKFKKSNKPSHALLHRLSLKTEGQLWTNPSNSQIKSIIEQIQSSQFRVYKITYTTLSKDSSLWPRDSVMIRASMTGKGSTWSTISSFQIPLDGYLEQNFGRSISIIFFVLTILLIIFIFLVLFFILSSRSVQKRNIVHNPIENTSHQTAPDIAPYLESTVSNKQPQDDASIELITHDHMSFPANTIMDDERKLYMREYNYRLLQLGLREAVECKKASLVTKKKQATGGPRQYDLFLETTILGSGRWANIPVHDNTISPIHAKLKKVENRYVIYDLLSAGGVFVNGKKILRPRGLKDNDEIRIGRSVLYFKCLS